MFKGELKGTQVEVANKMCARKCILVGMPQGSGKSVVSIAAAEKLFELKLAYKAIILCPTSITWQWKERIEEFGTDDVWLAEAKNKLSRQYGANEALYTIIPYSLFRKDYETISTNIDLKSSIIIADEAQEFSSFRSKTFKLIKKFKADYRWALTGTAISNKLEELYAIMEWVDPYFLPYWTKFEKNHIVRNHRTRQIIRYKNLDELHKYLKSKRFVRKTLEELKGSLPEIVTQKIYIEKDKGVRDSERDLYTAVERMGSSDKILRFDPEVSKALHKAREAVTSEAKLASVRTLLERILSESDNNRVIIFNFHKRPLYNLEAQLAVSGISSALFTGDESTDRKRESVEQFKQGHAKVLLCSNAGSTGLDLPFANYVIHLDVPFSHGTLDQRSKRIQRASSLFSSVVVIHMIVKNSIEEYYLAIVGSKSNLSDAVLEGKASKVTMRPESLKRYLKRVIDEDRQQSRRVQTT